MNVCQGDERICPDAMNPGLSIRGIASVSHRIIANSSPKAEAKTSQVRRQPGYHLGVLISLGSADP